MNFLMNKYSCLNVILLLSSFMPVFADQHDARAYSGKKDTAQVSKVAFVEDSNSCNALRVGTLKAAQVIARCLQAQGIAAECISTDTLNASALVADAAYLSQLYTQTISTQAIISSSVDAQTICTNDLSVAGTTCLANLNIAGACVTNLAANDLCVTGTLKVANLLNCGVYRATAVFDTNTTYTLGDFINFNLIIDDPGSDITVAPVFEYKAPVSGYYIVTLQIDQDTLQPFNNAPVLGVPVSNPQIYVNGIVLRQSYVPYLTFFNEQKTTLTSLLSLAQGDVVQAIFEVLALNQINGIIPIAGTVNILGNGTEEDQSIFKISLLNVDCDGAPCTPCNGQAPCVPCTPLQQIPYTTPASCPPCHACVPCQC